ncbi:MAG: M20/M25/M40 family metallo-hydrolase [Chloroflexi bacterium]|nr:M20/M25/M40 family metallo-hydrolase [Chloroflexota bacterium]
MLLGALIFSLSFLNPGLPPVEANAAGAAAIETMEMVSEVDAGRMIGDIGTISGYSRCSATAGKDDAASFIAGRLRSLGLDVRLDSFTGPDGNRFTNVIGEKRGASDPSRVAVLAAHFDSMPSRQFPPNCSAGPAPGANDDASGVAAVLEAARVMSARNFAGTVRFVLFDGEEYGHFGSKHYAESLAAGGETIEAAIDLDMVGYENDGGTRLFAVHDGRASQLLAVLNASVARYGIPVTLGNYALGTNWPANLDPNRLGDHLSFWNAGYGDTVGISEDIATDYGNDPAYHSSGDTLYKPDGSLRLRPDLMSAAAKLSVAALSDLAGPQGRDAWQAPSEDFYRLWERTDRAVEAGLETRSWFWGPKPIDTRWEPYEESPTGERLVQYFDKGRVEDNGGSVSGSTTAGLLVEEMVTGRVQTGDHSFATIHPSDVPVAGDLSQPGNASPSYSDFAAVSWPTCGPEPNRVGQYVSATIDGYGKVGIAADPAALVPVAAYDPNLGHNIPQVFWDFMNQEGLVADGGYYVNGVLMNWTEVLGLPISEPFWTKAFVSGEERDVLVQLFERRVLTYTPSNPEEWQVEMGNAGLHYLEWRYGPASPASGYLMALPAMIRLERFTSSGSTGSSSADTTSSGLPAP